MKYSRLLSPVLALALIVSLLTSCGSGTGGSTWQDQYDLGMRYLSEGNYEEAIIAFTAAIELDPKRPEAFIGRGDAYVLSGETGDNLAAALADYQAALDLDETLVQAWLGLADVYIRQGDYDKALELLQEALDKTGGDQSIADKIGEMEENADVSAEPAVLVQRTNVYDETGNLQWYHAYTYDEHGNCIQEDVCDLDGTRRHYYTYEYNSEGKQVQKNTYHQDNTLSEYRTYEYDQSGKRTRANYYYPDGSFWHYETYEYDDQGNLVRLNNCFPDGESQYYETYEYDQEGHLTQQNNYNSLVDGSLSYYWLHLYDENGQYLGYDWYTAAGDLMQSRRNEW